MASFHVLLDESGQESTALPVQVCAAVFEDLDASEAVVSELYADWCSAPELRAIPSFQEFLEKGFHNWQIPFEIQLSFIRQLRTLGGFRAFIAFSKRTRLRDHTDNELAAVLYAALLPDVLLYLRARQVELHFETNSGLNHVFADIVSDCAARASDKASRPVPVPRLTIVDKLEYTAMGVTDFILAIVGKWIAAEMTRDATQSVYRNYVVVEPSVAMIYDFDTNTRSTRSHRAFR